ncbi:hypothetical protein AB4Z51_27745 [Bradyrhizobium sp. 2TAF36]|uniref:hypothetical protein n=1 Tax=Bradyrhizobium sp. 2TAF36 TaxID=3233016 RepID=UPI003F9010DD
MIDPSKPKETARSDQPLSIKPNRRPEITQLQEDHRSDGKGPREPIFGTGAAPFLAELIITVGAISLVLIVLMLASVAKQKASGLLFGTSPQARPLEPDKAKVIEGYEFKRIN